MIRKAMLADAPAIAKIYEYYVLETTITYEVEPPDAKEMSNRWKNISANYPYLVMEEKGQVIGYAYGARFRERKAFDPTTEVSIYLDKDYCADGRGHPYGAGQQAAPLDGAQQRHGEHPEHEGVQIPHVPPWQQYILQPAALIHNVIFQGSHTERRDARLADKVEP